MNVVSLQDYREQRCDCSATCPRAVKTSTRVAQARAACRDEDDDDLDLEDEGLWKQRLAWLPLLACWLLALAAFTPTVRLLCWGVLWVAYLAGTEAAPPAPYTFWAP